MRALYSYVEVRGSARVDKFDYNMFEVRGNTYLLLSPGQNRLVDVSSFEVRLRDHCGFQLFNFQFYPARHLDFQHRGIA